MRRSAIYAGDAWATADKGEELIHPHRHLKLIFKIIIHQIIILSHYF
jgi:hypothetical protein